MNTEPEPKTKQIIIDGIEYHIPSNWTVNEQLITKIKKNHKHRCFLQKIEINNVEYCVPFY